MKYLILALLLITAHAEEYLVNEDKAVEAKETARKYVQDRQTAVIEWNDTKVKHGNLQFEVEWK